MIGGILSTDVDGSFIRYMLNNLVNDIVNKKKIHMQSNLYNEIISNFIIIDNSTIELKDILINNDNYSIAKKYWYLYYINKVLIDVYNYVNNLISILGRNLDSINTENKIKNYLDKMKDEHKIEVFEMDKNSIDYILTEYIRNTRKTDYMNLISNMNSILKDEIMKVWRVKEINEPVSTISAEVFDIIDSKVENNIDSYYKSDLDIMDNNLTSSENQLNNIKSFLTTTHRPEINEMLDSNNVMGYLSGGYKLINLDL